MISLPAELHSLIGDSPWDEETIGESGTQVFRVVITSGLTCYLKVAVLHLIAELQAEKERLLWLQGRLPVPQVLYYGEAFAKAYLLLSEVPGKLACDPLLADRLPQVVESLAKSLRLFHSLKLADCPFDQSLAVKVEKARYQLEAGLVDEEDFDDERQGLSGAELFEQLKNVLPTLAAEDLVFTHGDFCLPNVLLDPVSLEISGFIDLGRSGVADRYQDLALATRSLAYNWGAEWVEPFLAAYGIPPAQTDYAKLDFYRLLDEFF